eukprot:TRINITY_DN14474_c0_g1_i1.p1 TRINITY_DN14474_c0_g1~~TRINITY_DN14474_c0_g1_i1.p1  ORF type:complete len:631 (+),score=165.69 TRINITY_DN14474_c0_g1_i1:328-2220(+)
MLTRLLAESFGGSSKTCLVITCSTKSQDREETRCSLEFGKRAKLVKNKAEVNLEVTTEPTPVIQALVAKEITDLKREMEVMVQERELLLADRTSLTEGLAEAKQRASDAVADCLMQQEKRSQEVRDLVEEKAALQRRWAEAASSASELQSAFAAETTRLCVERAELHSQLQEAVDECTRLWQQREADARVHEAERAQLSSFMEQQSKLCDERGRTVENLREELRRASEDKAAAIARLEQENASLRERWLQDVQRLEAERLAVEAELRQERSELPRRIEAALRSAQVQVAPSDSVATSGSTPPPVVVQSVSVLAPGAAEKRFAAARLAEEEGARLVAWCRERQHALQRDVEAADASAAAVGRQREARLSVVEADAAELARKWKATAASAAMDEATGSTIPSTEEVAMASPATESCASLAFGSESDAMPLSPPMGDDTSRTLHANPGGLPDVLDCAADRGPSLSDAGSTNSPLAMRAAASSLPVATAGAVIMPVQAAPEIMCEHRRQASLPEAALGGAARLEELLKASTSSMPPACGLPMPRFNPSRMSSLPSNLGAEAPVAGERQLAGGGAMSREEAIAQLESDMAAMEGVSEQGQSLISTKRLLWNHLPENTTAAGADKGEIGEINMVAG